MDERYFKNICVSTGVALIATDEQLRIQFWNHAATRILGGSADSMMGQPVASIVPAERRELANRLLERALNKAEVSEFDFRYHTPQGEPAHLAVNISPILGDGDNTIGVSIYVRNVSRRIELEKEMAQTQKMSALGSMAGALAHHLNNLLGGIITSVDFVSDSDDPAILHRVLRSTSNSLSRISDITLGLLAFAEGEHGNQVSTPFSEIIHNYIREIKPELDEQKIQLETDIDDISLPMPNKCIQTVLASLTNNAREAMPQGGQLRIEAKYAKDTNTIYMRVCDTGSGISEQVLPHIFEPFYTTKKNSSEELTGHAGLGLAVVHGIVKDLGGTTTVCSSRDTGTACSVQLPAQPTIPHRCQSPPSENNSA